MPEHLFLQARGSGKRLRRRRFSVVKSVAVLAAAGSVLAPLRVWAGPPFITDDPEPVEPRHGEFYVSSIYQNNRDGQQGTLPHFEFNYGPLPELQLHLLFPLAFAHPNGGTTSYGPGDTELGVKYRFIRETDLRPQVGTFPLVEVPTGDSGRGLGSGHVQTFLPIWLQKSWGPWTTYGGGGYWINPGTGNRDFWQLGWLGQRDINKYVTLGGEIYQYGRSTVDGRNRSGFNIGGFINVTEEHHILFSAGSDIWGDNRFSSYLGYQLTFGPKEEKK